MKNKKFPALGKGSTSLAALALAACILLTPAGQDVGSARAEFIRLDLPCSLTVLPGDFEGRDLKDLEMSDVVVDLYRVADAVQISGYDAYAFDFGTDNSYQALEDLVKEENYKKAAQEAAKLTFTKNEDGGFTVSQRPVKVNMPANEAITGLTGGLYLLVARAPGTDPSEYVAAIDSADADMDAGKKETQIVTLAHSKSHTYTFLPELVALPSRMTTDRDPETGQLTVENNTANNVAWQYDSTVTLKPDVGYRYADLRIVKNLPAYVQNQSQEEVSFVFQVEAFMTRTDVDGTVARENVYSDVVALKFSQAGRGDVVIADKIPVGAQVTVTEVYSGADYTPDRQTQTIQAVPSPEDSEAVAAFTNTYQGTMTTGGAVVNRFVYGSGGTSEERSAGNGKTDKESDASSGWQWIQQ